ncbi:MAG TPA: hypothetical protein VER36_04985 [Flavisolibacter sp.]|nr:hypothetical protein [Flavisolibacter sp.]
MKSTVLTGILLLATGVAAHAQLSFLPQVGFERSQTCLDYNSFSTSGAAGAVKANLRADYRFKAGHGPYVGLGTATATASFSFDNAGTLMKGVQSTKSNLLFRIETGYQYTTKAIQLGKRNPSPNVDATQTSYETAVQKKSCGSAAYRSHCGSKKKTPETRLANTNLSMRLQPSLGLAYIPSATDAIQQTANGVEYNPGWKTAVVPAMGFEFAKGKQRLFTLTVSYTKPLAQQEQSFTDVSSVKAQTTNLRAATSAWGMTVGVPFSFAKSSAGKTSKAKKSCTKTYYRRCIRS